MPKDYESQEQRAAITEIDQIRLRLAAAESNNADLKTHIAAGTFEARKLRRERNDLKSENRDLKTQLRRATVALAIETSRRELKERDASEDKLTGLLNADGLFRKIRELLSGGQVGVYILIDANKFKPINDQYGHLAGDKALKALADKIQEHFAITEGSVVGRVGGDEFGVFSPQSQDEIKQKLPKNSQGEPCVVCNFEIERGKVEFSASVGMADLKDQEGLEEAVNSADSEMYRSKRISGNGGR